MALTLLAPGRTLLPADWTARYAFRDFAGIDPDVTRVSRAPETWLAAGGRGRPVVCATRMPGLAFPLMAFYRAPGTKADTVTCSLAEDGLAEAVMLDGLLAVVARTLPAYAELVLEGDALAVVTLAGVAPKRWHADRMLSCLRDLVAGCGVTAA